MPLYDFKCNTCGEIAEFLVSSMADYSQLSCPGCGSRNLERLISAPRLLKGSAGVLGTTCCGRGERCEKPPCSADHSCRWH